MEISCPFTVSHHAQQRMQQQNIPAGIVDLIMEFGHSRNAGDGARKHTLTKESFRAIRRSYGREVADAMNRYRRAYIVAAGDKIITAAFANQPLFI
jgi:hypothetical protein